MSSPSRAWRHARLVLKPLSPSIASDPIARGVRAQLEGLIGAVRDPSVSREELVELPTAVNGIAPIGR